MKSSIADKYGQMINRIGEYVHSNLAEPISLEVLAKEVGVSKYHLNRLFHAGTGLKLGEFIQRRRMEHAYHLLAEQRVSVLDAALSVGYDSHSSFSRAFSKLFSVEPGKVKSGCTPKFALPKLVKTNERPTLSPEILELPMKKLVGLYGHGFEKQSFFMLAQQLYHQLSTQLNLPEGFDFKQQQLIGVALDSPWRGEQSKSRFFAGVDLSASDLCEHHNLSELSEYVWTQGRWARFEHAGPYNTIWQTILSIYANWVIPNNFELKNCSIVQHYLNNVNITEPADLRTHIYIPLDD